MNLKSHFLWVTYLLLAIPQVSFAQYNFNTVSYPGATGTAVVGIDGSSYVGSYFVGSPSSTFGFYYNGANYISLSDPSATTITTSNGISGNTIVGYYGNSTGMHGYTYNISTQTYITLDDPSAATGSPGIGTFATGVSGGNIVGYYYDSSNAIHGFLYNGSNYLTLDYPSATSTYAYGISGNNVVGSAGSSGFVYNGSGYLPVAYPSSYSTSAFGISGSEIAGFYTPSSGSNPNGFLFDGSHYTTVNDPLGTQGTRIIGISGTSLVGNYTTSSGTFAFVATLTPEPSTVFLFGLSLGLIAILSYRKSGLFR